MTQVLKVGRRTNPTKMFCPTHAQLWLGQSISGHYVLSRATTYEWQSEA